MQPAPDRLSDRRFAAIAHFVEGSVGIKLPPSKRIMVEGRLRRRVRALGLSGLDDYAAHLFDRGALGAEAEHLVDCVTTNKTDFFREPAHFDFLRGTAVPRLVGQRTDRTLKVWSSASSIGAEAYTIAMVLQDMVAAGARFHFSVLGTDVSRPVLEQARAAVYAEAMVEPVPAAMRQRYLMPSRAAGDARVRIVPELRRLVQFHSLNLMDPSYPFDRDVDVIFCRNVLIYFDAPTQAAVVERLAGHLRPGGYLILGHSESMAGNGLPGLTSILPTIYRREA
ncbi:protein-glutamate O-methyltransferase CheR [Lichenibacterium minor]|uniref:Chemotaxis protein methyltransferase n=1 Tax=Lichenibacterium minor TaxID=2316528 RepID=A0A4Q2TY30_9HYPH|nr:protein-glutamate O-methyltransferase CheR [Lichenibacterium minor]RYC28983.1 protein-glutamate O-methyltransferase CheR [Lichenibacterium minor]